MRILVQSTLCLVLLAPGAASSAETLFAAGGKPGVVTKVGEKEDSLVLTIKSGFSAKDVADVLTNGVPGAKCKVDKSGAVIVSGVSKEELTAALERLEVSPELDDIDAMLSNMQGAGAQDEGSGSSIRATKVAELAASEGAPLPRVVGTVVKVRHQRYPLVALRVKVMEVGELKGVSVGQEIEVVPLTRRDRKDQSVDATVSRNNAKAWYARPGDQVVVELKARGQNDVFVAATYQRKAEAR